MARPPSDTEIYKSTYKQLVEWVKTLSHSVVECKREAYILKQRIRANIFREQRCIRLENLNHQQAALIMQLEFRNVMMEKEYGVAQSDVVSLEEFKRSRLNVATRHGGGPPEGQWLTGLTVGTEFLVRPKVQKTWMLAKFMHAGQKENNVLVIPMKGEEVNAPESEWLWVDPEEFCKFWELRGILLVPKEEE